MRNYYEELYAKKIENLGEMDTYLEKYNLPKLNEEEAENLNRPITPDGIEMVVKSFQPKKALDQMVSQENLAKDELTPILHRLFQKIQEDVRLLHSFLKLASS